MKISVGISSKELTTARRMLYELGSLSRLGAELAPEIAERLMAKVYPATLAGEETPEGIAPFPAAFVTLKDVQAALFEERGIHLSPVETAQVEQLTGLTLKQISPSHSLTSAQVLAIIRAVSTTPKS